MNARFRGTLKLGFRGSPRHRGNCYDLVVYIRGLIYAPDANNALDEPFTCSTFDVDVSSQEICTVLGTLSDVALGVPRSLNNKVEEWRLVYQILLLAFEPVPAVLSGPN